MVAEVFPAGAAVFAGAVGGVQPGDADARAEWETGVYGFDCADDLMAGDQGRFARGEFGFDDVEVGTADAAGFDAHVSKPVDPAELIIMVNGLLEKSSASKI